MLGTLMRAGDVLDLFTLEEPEWGVTAAAQRLGIGKSLAHEALATLAEIGLLQRVGHGRSRLGWRPMSLASVLMRSSGLTVSARPIMRQLAEEHGVAVSLLAREREQMITISRLEPVTASRRSGPAAGMTAPTDDSAPARVLLADRTPAEVAALWSAGRLTTRHGTLDALMSDLERVRLAGCAVDEPASGAPVAAAAPIRDPGGDVSVAICLSAPCPGGEPAVRRLANLATTAASRVASALRVRVAAA